MHMDQSGTFSYLNFALCLHAPIISALLFSIVVGSAVAMVIFSVKQTSHRLVPHLYGAATLAMLQFTSCGWLLSFRGCLDEH